MVVKQLLLLFFNLRRPPRTMLTGSYINSSSKQIRDYVFLKILQGVIPLIFEKVIILFPKVHGLNYAKRFQIFLQFAAMVYDARWRNDGFAFH